MGTVILLLFYVREPILLQLFQAVLSIETHTNRCIDNQPNGNGRD